jgi:restriction system protein
MSGDTTRAIPSYNKLMMPLLRLTADGETHAMAATVDTLATYFNLPEDDTRGPFYSRVQGARTYLQKAGLLERSGRGLFKITPRGEAVLDTGLPEITLDFLKQFPEFRTYLALSRLRRRGDYNLLAQETPHRLMQTAYENLQVDLAEDLLAHILNGSPAFFEQLVIDLLLAMGYGGSRQAAGKAIGRSGDGGLDGYIQEDKLGLEKLYVQAKRYARDTPVGRPAVQGFVGSLMGAGATRGVFLTTSRFSGEALDYAKSVPNVKLILIDGQQLTELMIEHNVGVRVEQTYVVKRVDTDYFETSDT